MPFSHNKKKNNRKFGLYISLGIEANNLILSGLATKLQESGDVVALCNYESPILSDMLIEYGIVKQNISDLKLKKQVRSKTESFFLSSRRARLRLNGIIPIGWRGNSTKKRFKDYLIGNSAVYVLFNRLTWRANGKHYFNEELATYIQEQCITDLVVQSYSSPDVMCMAITAKKLGCKVWVMNWGWKDFFVNEFIPFNPNGFFTWNSKVRSLYLKFNAHLKPVEVFEYGNSGYDSFYYYKPAHDKEFYSRKYGFELGRPIVLYTLMNPDVYAHEREIITKVIDSLKALSLDVVLLLKPNPMDKNIIRLVPLTQQNKNVAITDNMWLYDSEHNFNLMTTEAKVEWLDLLYHCDLTMNIPSTVTIESLIMKKPVVNIGFGAIPSDDSQILRFAYAPYYLDLFKRNDVELADKPDTAGELVMKALSNGMAVSETMSELLTFNDHTTDDVVQTILEG